MEIHKPKFLIENLLQTIDITDEEILKIRDMFIKHISIEDIFHKVNPKLKESYLTRLETFKDYKSEDDEKEKENNFIKIPKEKMNLEERFLNAFFCDTNIRDDLNDLLEYMNKIHEIIRFENPTKIDKFSEGLIPLVIKEALTNHYSAKIKLLYPDAEDEDIKYNITPRYFQYKNLF